MLNQKKVKIFDVPPVEGGILASEYMEANYNFIVNSVRKKGVYERAEDLVHDVYLSFLEKEREGEYFNPDLAPNIEAYVWGRIKKYTKNKKYWGDSVAVQEIPCNPLEPDTQEEIGAEESMQYKYFCSLKVFESLEMVEIEATILQDIRHLLSYEEEFANAGFSIRKILKKIKKIKDGISEIDPSFFAPLRKVLKKKEELGEVFRQLIFYATDYPERYKEVLVKAGV